MKVLAIGGTGTTGSRVVEELTKRGAEVRLFSRKPLTQLPERVEAAVGDLLDPVSVERALDGVDKLYLLNG